MQSHLQENLAILVLQVLNNSQLKYKLKTNTLFVLGNLGRGTALLSSYKAEDDFISNGLHHANMVKPHAP